MPADQPQHEMSFLEHLEALRWHLVRSFASIIVFSIIAFASKDFVFGTLILGPSEPDFWFYQTACEIGKKLVDSTAFCMDELPFIIQNRKVTGQFSMHITVSLVLGFIMAFPYFFWEMWRFISPALYDNEKKGSKGAVFFVTLLFTLGILFGYYIVTPISINFLSNYQVYYTIENYFDLSSYVSTITMLVLACGLMFQLPMIIFFLSRSGLITPSLLRNYRRHAIVVILVVGAIITPPDPISQVLIALPIMLLYEISISVSGSVLKKRMKQQNQKP